MAVADTEFATLGAQPAATDADFAALGATPIASDDDFLKLGASPLPPGLLARMGQYIGAGTVNSQKLQPDVLTPGVTNALADFNTYMSTPVPYETVAANTQAFREGLEKPLINLPQLPDFSNLPQPDGTFSTDVPALSPAQAAGIYNAAAPSVSAMTSPENLAFMAGTAGLGVEAKAGSLLAKAGLAATGAGFGGAMGVDTYKLAKQAQAVLANPDTTEQERTAAVLKPIVSGVMSLGALAGAGRLAAGEAIPRLNAAFPELFWKKSGIDAGQFAATYPSAVRRVATNTGSAEDIALVQTINDAAKASGVKVGDLARGRVVAENVQWTPRAIQQLLPDSLKPTAPGGGSGLSFRAAGEAPTPAGATPDEEFTAMGATPIAEEQPLLTAPTQGSSVVEQLPHTETVAGSTPAPAPIQQPPATPNENAPPIPSPGAPVRDDTGAAPAPQAVAGGGTPEDQQSPEARIASSPPQEENQVLNPTPAPAPLPPGWSPVKAAGTPPAPAPSNVPTNPPTEPAPTPAAVGGPAPAPAQASDEISGAGSGGLAPSYTMDQAMSGPGISTLLKNQYKWDEAGKSFIAPAVAAAVPQSKSFSTQQQYQDALWAKAFEVIKTSNLPDIKSPTYTQDMRRSMEVERQFNALADEVGLSKTKRRYMIATAGYKARGEPLPRPADLGAGPLDAQRFEPPKPTDFNPDIAVRRARSEKPIEALDTKAEIEFSINHAKSILRKGSGASPQRRAQMERILGERQKQLEKGQYIEARIAAENARAPKVPASATVTPTPTPLPSTPTDIPTWAKQPITVQHVTQPALMQTATSRAPLLARVRQKIANLKKLRADVEEGKGFPPAFIQHLERVATNLAERHARVEKRLDDLARKANEDAGLTKAEDDEQGDLETLQGKLADQLETAQDDVNAAEDPLLHDSGLDLIDKWLATWQRRLEIVEGVRLKAAQSGALNKVSAGFTPRTNGRSAASPGMPSAPPMQAPPPAAPGVPPTQPPPPTMLRPQDDPNFSQLPFQLPEMVQLFRLIASGKNPRIVDQINALHGTALGVFRYREGDIDSGRIELRADLFHLLSQAEKNALMQKAVAWAKLMKEANPDLDLGEAIRHKFEQLVKEAEAEAMQRDPGRALYVFAHEIGHYIDFLPDGTLKRGNILGHMATLHTYLKNFIGNAPDIFPVAPTSNERAALRRQAEKELNDAVKEITETITREEPIYAESGLTAKMITEVVGQTAREDFPEFYDWFAKLSRADKVDVLKKAMRGIVDERAARFAKRVQTGTKTVIEEVTHKTAEVTEEAIKARYTELLRAELKKRGLISLQDIKKELSGVIAWWHKRETMPAYFRSGAEMYAETFSILMNNPAALQARAPTWWSAFQQYMVRKPAVLKVYNQVQNDIKSGAIFTQRVENLRGSWEDSAQTILEKELAAADIPIKKYWAYINLHLNKQQGPIQALAIKQWEKPEAGRLLGALKNYLYRQTAVESLGRQINMRVEKLLAEQSLTHTDLSEYMFHNRIVNGDAVEKANSQGWSPNTSQQRLDEMRNVTFGPTRFAALQKAQREMRDIYATGVIPLLQGIVSPELFKIISDNAAFVPFQKAPEAFNPLTQGHIVGLLDSQYGPGTTAKIFKRTGYLGDIKSPYMALINKAESLTRFALKQRVINATVDFMREYDRDRIEKGRMVFNGHFMVPEDRTGSEVGTLMALNDGKVTGWHVPREIYDTIERVGGSEGFLLHGALRALAWPKALLTELNVGFWPARFVKDLGAFALQMPGGIGALRYLPRGLKAAHNTFTTNPDHIADQLLARLMVISRADHRGVHIGSTDETGRWFMRLNQHPEVWGEQMKGLERVLRLWEVYKQMGQVGARTTKAMGMMHLDAKYGTLPPGAPTPAGPSLEWIALPEWMKKRIVNEYSGHAELLERGASIALPELAGGPIFINPFLRSIESFYRAQGLEPGLGHIGRVPVPTIRRQKGFNDPVGVWSKFLLFVALPTMAAYAFYKGWTNMGMSQDRAEDMRKMYRSIPEQDKLRGMVLPLAWADKTQGKVLYMIFPYPEQVRLLHAMFRKMLQSANGEHGQKTGMDSMLSFAAQDTPGTNPAWTAVKHWIELEVLGQNPYDSFRGRPMLNEKVFAAGQGAGQLAHQSLADVTGGMIPPPIPNVPGVVPTQLENFLHKPIVNTLLGRWVKISNAGINEENQTVMQPADARRAQLEIIGDEILRKQQNHEQYTESEKTMYSSNAYLQKYILTRSQAFAAGAMGPEVDAFLKGNEFERAALLKLWADRAAAARARVNH